MDKLENQEDQVLAELADILESNLANKTAHLHGLKDAYPLYAKSLQSAYDMWSDLTPDPLPQHSQQMDDGFYKLLVEETTERSEVSDQQEQGRVVPLRAPWWAVAATFIFGLVVGSLLWPRQQTVISESYAHEQQMPRPNSQVAFASLEKSPSAFTRMKEIKSVQEQDRPDLRVIEALNQVILHDPNVNVRLVAIQTMLHFADIPEARAYLIEAIPYQTTPMVQLELADIMIELEERSSASQWEQLLSSENVKTEVRMQLTDNLKTIL